MSPKTAIITLILIILSGSLFVFYLSVMNSEVGTETVDFSAYKNQKQQNEENVNVVDSGMEAGNQDVKKVLSEEEMLAEKTVEEIREDAKDRPYTQAEIDRILGVKQ